MRATLILSRKLSAFFLVLALIVSSPLAVLAQESPVDVGSGGAISTEPTQATPDLVAPSEPTLDAVTADTTEPTADPAASNAEVLPASPDETVPADEKAIEQAPIEDEALGDQPQMMMAGQGPTSPTISNPSLFSYQTLQPRVDRTSGALTFSVPLDIPKGRNGLEPKLALSYNSANLDDHGIVGYGWNVSIPSIERINKRGIENMYADNYFSSSHSGELATTTVASSTVYTARVDDGTYIRYTFTNNSWVAYDKQGTKYTFGANASAQLVDPNSATRIYRWMLEEVRDTNNNYITYTYVKDGNQLYPSTITYTGNGVTAGAFSVAFTTASSTVSMVSYRPGFAVTTGKRITTITASNSGTMLRQYNLTYTTGNNGYRSLLWKVEQQGRDALGTTLTMPPIIFSYENTAVTSIGVNGEVPNQTLAVADANGDSLNDESLFRYVNFSGATQGFVNGSGISTPPEYWAYTDNNGDVPYETGTRFIDVNGDGYADVVRSGDGISKLYLNTSSSTPGTYVFSPIATSSLSGVIPEFKYMSGGSYATGGLLGNINGDAAIDYTQWVGGLPSTKKTYLGNGMGWLATSTLYAPVWEMPGFSGTPVTNSQLVDINADGIDDWVYSFTDQTKVCFNTGLAWQTDCNSAWSIGTTTFYFNSSSQQYFDGGIRFLDVNGDGLTDFVRSYSNTASTYFGAETGTSSLVLLNTGSGWATSTATFNYFITSYTGTSGTLTNREAYDDDGDGVPTNTTKHDILKTITYPQQGTTQVSFANPATLGSNANLGLPRLVVTSLISNDQNGVTDTRTYSYAGGKLFMDRGLFERTFAGFASITETRSDGTRKTYFNQGDSIDTASGEQSDDYAFIGKPFREDVLATSTTLLKRIFTKWLKSDITTSTTTSAVSTTTDFYTYGGDGSVGYWGPSNFTTAHNASVGQNGTGVTGVDMSAITGGGINWYGSGSWQITRAFLPFDTRLLPANAVVSSSTLYVRGYSYVNGANVSLIPSTQGATSTLVDADYGRVSFTQLATDKSSSDFGASPGTLQAWSLNASGIANIAPATTTRMAIVTAYDQSNTTPANNFNNGLAGIYTSRAGSDKPYLRITYSSGTTTSSVPGGAQFALVSNQLTQFFDQTGSGTHKDRAVEYIYATSTGDLVTATDKGEVIGSTDGTYTDTSSDTRTTTRSYVRNETANLSALTNETVKNNAGTTVKEIRRYYDGATTTATTTKGNLTKEENWITGSTYASTTRSYNSYGLVASSTDPRGNVTHFAYDTTLNRDVSSTTNALGHNTQATYDLATGQATQITSPNGLVREFTFDGVGRLTAEKQPDLTTPAALRTKRTIAYTDNTLPSSTLTTSYLDLSTSTLSYEYFDGFGRSIQTRTKASPTNTYAVRDRVLNTVGLTLKSSLPYFASSTAWTAPTSTASLFSTFTYDAVERPLTNANAVGTTSYAYNGWSATEIDPNLNQKTLTRDAFNNLSIVLERNGTTHGTTTYAYDALNNLSSITDAAGNLRAFTYDGLSRRLTAEDLHASGDGTFGTYTYTYDTANNISSRVDPKSQTVNYTYDALNRPLSEDYTGASGTEVTYSYDSCQYGKGLLCSASTTLTVATSTYNALGLPQRISKKIWNTFYVSSSTYDFQGNPILLTAPNSAETKYDYDAAGFVTRIQFKKSGGTFTDVIRNLEYAPTGAVSKIRYANGLESSRTYDPLKAYRLVNAATYLPSTTTPTQVTADFYTYAGDGSVMYWGPSNFSTAHNASVGQNGTGVTGVDMSAITNGGFIWTGSGSWAIDRTFLPFDTRTIPTNASIDSATLYVRGYKYVNGGMVSLIPSTQAATSTLVDADYGRVSFTQLAADKDANDFGTSPGTLLPWTLNAAGLSNIGKGTTTKMAITTSYDRTNTDPGAFSGNNYGLGGIYTSRAGSDKPYLRVTYSSGGPNFLQNASLTYDAAGNITRIADNSSSLNNRDVTYTYDGLNRLVSASSTSATSTPFREFYTYDTLGSLTAKRNGATSTYAYAQTGTTNPHAPTSIGNGTATTTYAYDTNGNLTSAGTSTYSYDYENRMTQSVTMGATSTYIYDHTGARLTLASQSATSTYVDKTYSLLGKTSGATTTATTTNYIFLGDMLVALFEQPTINGSATGTATTTYVHTDHLNSTALMTNASGTVIQTLDYYPYGGQRISQSTNGADAKRRFIGEVTDASGLDYLNARYYDPARGQFFKQDPVFWELPSQLRGGQLDSFLKSPQSLNSYSYAEASPLVKKDPEGRCAGPFLLVCLGLIGANFGVWTSYAGGVLESRAQANPHPYQFDMSYSEIGTSATLGAFELAALPEKRAIGAAYAFGSSLAEDRTAGNTPNYGKAVVSGGTAVIAGTFFKNLVGNVPASLATRSQLSSQVFQNTSILVTNNSLGTNKSVPFQVAQSAAKAIGIGNTGSGNFVGTYNFGAGTGTFNFGTGTWTNAQTTPATTAR